MLKYLHSLFVIRKFRQLNSFGNRDKALKYIADSEKSRAIEMWVYLALLLELNEVNEISINDDYNEFIELIISSKRDGAVTEDELGWIYQYCWVVYGKEYPGMSEILDERIFSRKLRARFLIKCLFNRNVLTRFANRINRQ